MSVLNLSGATLKAWTLSDSTDGIGTTVGGNRYGWLVTNDFANLPLDNIVRSGNTAPVANAGGPYLVAVNTSIALDGSLSSDPDGDALTYAWSDSHTETTLRNESTVSPSFSATAPGIYTVTLTVCDPSGSCDFAEGTVVVYDPSAGFVTGGGWINSAAGAYLVDPALAGRANFGFVSKYKKGATAPDGNTQFQFQTAGLNFSSTSYEWLVVGGSQAQFKGRGTINGAGDYGFLLTARDQTAGDTFRIKIWDFATNVPIYDNIADTPLGGGSIVIHAK
jgi:PKD domain-containing protein